MKTLITNSSTTNFYNIFIKLLKECEGFVFNVAFINYSGVQLILDTLKECENKKIKGKILTSTYLNFTQAKALEKLSEFENIQLKIFDCQKEKRGFHSKTYIFEFEDCFKVLLGSSNITSSAFKTNIEWNIKTVLKKDEEFTKELLKEFDNLWENSLMVTSDFINKYKEFQDKTTIKEFVYEKQISANTMQNKALERLDFFRQNTQTKALAIASTGSGKTYLAAFDVKNFEAKNLLFLVHRENILIKAKQSFERIMPNKTCGLFTGNKKELDKQYLFSTIQTMLVNYKQFSKTQFDYIVIDEAHHITSNSYKEVINYFKPKFLLGLTATPNRTDGENIYEYFDENIACDIRLNEALEFGLVAPFHYYGINDFEGIDYKDIDISKVDEVAKLLMVNKRVDYIIEKMDFYGYSGEKRKVLGFCASKEHANYMNEMFNKNGIHSQVLTSEDSILKREETISLLEDEKSNLEIIFSVDIFNEGVDIPSINMVLFLRPTNSSIVFIQQLGRGLRKHKSKEFVTILDFIGNHNKTFLIALALLGEKAIDKDSVKLSLLNNFANINEAFINMDEISKQRVLEQLENENFNSFKNLKEQYQSFKMVTNHKIPMLSDFLNYSQIINPIDFISYSKSYIEFLSKVEKKKEYENICKDENFLKAIRFLDGQLNIKRVYEFVVLKYLLSNSFCDEKIVFNLSKKFLKNVCKDTIKHSFSYLNQYFFDISQKQRFLKLIEYKDKKVIKTKEFEEILEDKLKKQFIEESINFALLDYEEKFSNEDYGLPFLKLYEKYNMLNIAQLCNFNKIHSSFRGSGFLKYKNDFFLFITLEKDKFAKGSNYINNFLSNEVVTYGSKPTMSQDKGDGEKLIKNKEFGINLHLFVRKFSHVDKKVQNFIYLGVCDCMEYEGNKPINVKLKLQIPLSNNLYEEFTKKAETNE